MSLFAVSVPFPELASVVDVWRERTCVSKPSHAVPPHVTLLMPVPPDADAIAQTFRRFPPFDVTFAGFGRFPGALWLDPEPAETFIAMSEALMEAFPAHQPYGGAFTEVVPHLTVAQGDALDVVEVELAPLLPLTARATSAVLYEQAEPPHWRAAEVFEL